jgi:hypothetical protein
VGARDPFGDAADAVEHLAARLLGDRADGAEQRGGLGDDVTVVPASILATVRTAGSKAFTRRVTSVWKA